MKVKVKLDIKNFIERGDFRTLKMILSQQEPADILEMIEELPPTRKSSFFVFFQRTKRRWFSVNWNQTIR